MGNIRSSGTRQKQAYGRCVGFIQRNHVRFSLPNQPRQVHLPCRAANGLSEHSCRNCNTKSTFLCTSQKIQDAAVVAIQGD